MNCVLWFRTIIIFLFSISCAPTKGNHGLSLSEFMELRSSFNGKKIVQVLRDLNHPFPEKTSLDYVGIFSKKDFDLFSSSIKFILNTKYYDIVVFGVPLDYCANVLIFKKSGENSFFYSNVAIKSFRGELGLIAHDFGFPAFEVITSPGGGTGTKTIESRLFAWHDQTNLSIVTLKYHNTWSWYPWNSEIYHLWKKSSRPSAVSLAIIYSNVGNDSLFRGKHGNVFISEKILSCTNLPLNSQFGEDLELPNQIKIDSEERSQLNILSLKPEDLRLDLLAMGNKGTREKLWYNDFLIFIGNMSNQRIGSFDEVRLMWDRNK